MSLECCQGCTQPRPECIPLQDQMKSARANLYLLLTRQIPDMARPFQSQLEDAQHKLNQIKSNCQTTQ